MKVTIHIDENIKCKRCGKGGAITESGYCLECINKNLKEGYYDDMLNTEDRVHREQQLREEEKRQEND